jgi:hypothetical protein
MAYASTSATLPDRMLRASKLDVHLYEEVEADTNATNQALLVVAIVAVASGIGSMIGVAMAGSVAPGVPAPNPIGTLIGGLLNALIGWAVWSYVVFFVGTKLFGGTATYGELLRTLGFAESPGVLWLLSFIPVLGWLLALAAGIWVLVASFVGIRQALDIDNTKTILTIIVGVLAIIIVAIVVGIIVGAIFGAGMLLGGATVR